jgi:transcriptional antiterminator NusG
MSKKWYVVRASTAREETARKKLEKAIAEAGAQDYFGRLLIPEEHVTEVKNGEKHVIKRKLYSGYILAEMDLNDVTLGLVSETKGLGGFVGADRKTPTALTAKEIEKILEAMEEGKDKPKMKVEYEIGATVKISSGPFESYDGFVEEVYPEKGLLKVNVSIFGRQTPVELEYWQVERT